MSSYAKHYPKRHHWQKSKSAGYAYRKPEPRKDMTAIPASTHSRTKLKAFQFVDGRPNSAPNQDEEDKENLFSQSSRKSLRSQEPQGTLQHLSQEKVRQSVEEQNEEPQAPAGLARSKTCPITTPKTRLPIADLVGNAEVASLHLGAKIPSPDQHIYWEHAPSPGRARSGGSPAAGKKRARSSSPVCGSQNDPPNSAVRDGSDVGTLRRAMRTPMKTPKVDPAADLWNRYATTKDTPSNAKTPGVNQLLLDSSPRSDDTAGSVGGLRRWMSCGGQWPTSRSKRRKTSHFNLQPNDQTELFKDVGAISKVGMLVERIQETLPRRSSSREASNFEDPTSSPVREGPGASGGATSPLQRLGSITEDQNEPTEDRLSQTRQDKHPSKGSSDYGDFDSEMLAALDAKEQSNGSQRNMNIHEPAHARLASQPRPEADQPNLPSRIEEDIPRFQATTTPQVRADEDELDEFGDDDLFDEDIEGLCAQYDNTSNPAKEQQASSSSIQNSDSLLDADMEELCAQYDTGIAKPHRDVSASNQAPVGDTSHEDSYHTAVAEQIDNDDNASEDFGDSDIDIEDFVAAEMAATQAPILGHAESQRNKQSPSEIKSNSIKQYRIIEIVEGSYNNNGGQSPEKLLLVEEEKSKRRKTITLRQSWHDTPCEPEFLVHVVGSFTGPRESECIVDDSHNMLILYPDHLLSATVVSDSFGCIRRAVLGDRVKATSNTNAPQMYGHMLHELFQEAMKANRWENHWLEEKIRSLLPRYFESMAEINTSEVRVMEHLRSKLPELQGWAKVFVKDTPGPDAVVEARGGEKVSLSINKLLDVEEHVWAPAYGLKGNIDATIQMVMKDSTGEKTLAVPLEVKTGKNTNVVSHSAQTALYTLLLSDRYDIDIAYGILYYLESSKVIRVSALRREIIHMIKKRNEIACYARDRTRLPPMLQNSHMCGKCFAQQPCFIYHRLLEDGNDETIGPKGAFNDLVRYLGPGEQQFFQKWDTLLTKEEGEVVKIKRELWTMMSLEREKVGRCFSNVVIEPGSAEELGEVAKINRYRYTFRKQQPSPGFSFTESQIAVGEPIVISDEKGHYALANGYITNVSRRSVTVAVDRRLHNARTKAPGFDIDNNQVFAGIMEVTKEGMAPDPTPIEDVQTVYRIDKDEFSNGMATVRNNLIQLMDNSVYKSCELRTLIIHDRAPIFTPPSSAYLVQTESSQISSNPDQRAAIEKVLSARDYALVLGMPGTGKTTTISQIIRALVAKGKSVLLASYTHTAVDNILLKIRDDNIGILRLGAVAKVHPEVQQFAILGGQATTSLEELERNWVEPPVVATTCLGINHPIFARRVFDYCIVDEASQITLPVCLGPIRMARTFVLVGDHYQLPPLVQNKEALDGGLDVSLFKYLCERQPSAVVSLSTQYRMCEDVMALANKLIYSGQLKCGNEAVAGRSLVIDQSVSRCALASCHWPSDSKPETSQGYRPFMPSTPAAACLSHSQTSCYLSRLLKPETRVLFLDTDPLRPESHEQIAGQRIQNPTEATLIASMVATLVGSGVPASDIGVVTFFRSQLALLRRRLQAHLSHRRGGGVELHTADRFQGRDKEIILVSCVRSNDAATVGELLKDWRRINVALTRARSKLIVVGSGETLSKGDPVLKGLVELCTERGWIMGLPKGATESHYFEDINTQALTPSSRVGSSSKKPASGKIFSQSQAQRDRGSPVKKSQAERVLGGARKRPDKVGKMGKQALSGRPVLRDIVNEALGDVGLEDL